MALKERVNQEMKAALLGGDRFIGETLRNLKAAILNEEVATGKRDTGLSDEEIEKVVAREVKKRIESAKLYRDNARPELAEIEEQEMTILQGFLPAQLSEEELRAIVERKAAELDVSSPADMGRLIGAVKAEVGNTTDGGTIARIVKDVISK